MGAGNSYRERQRDWVKCTECGDKMVVGSLAVHLQMQHEKKVSVIRNWETTTPVMEPHTYRMDFRTTK